MSVVVNLDLVVPAIIESEFSDMKSMGGYETNKDQYLEAMTISATQIMNYASSMKSWDLGRVVVNFDREDAVRYLQSNPRRFKQISPSHIYSIKIPKNSDESSESRMKAFIRELTSEINYSTHVLRTVGLLHG